MLQSIIMSRTKNLYKIIKYITKSITCNIKIKYEQTWQMEQGRSDINEKR